MTQQPSKATHETLGRSSDLLNTWYANLKIFKARGTVPYKAIFCEDIPLHRPYIGLIYGRYLQWIGSWNGHWPMKPMTGKLWKAGNYRKQRPNHRTGIRTWTMMDNNQRRCHANWIYVKFSKWGNLNTSQRPWVSVLKWSNLDNLRVPPF